MAYENASHIDEFDQTSPADADDPFTTTGGAAEFRQIKKALKTDFPGITGAFTGTQTDLNRTDITTEGTAEASKVLTASATSTFTATGFTWTDLGTVTTADINGGTLDGVTIGATTAPTVTNIGSVATADINGGTIDGVTIGATTPPTVTNLGTVTTADINGGTIDGTTIGGTTPAAGTFTNALATGTTGYTTGAGGSVTQTISRTTSVTINDICGQIVLVSGAGSGTGSFWSSGKGAGGAESKADGSVTNISAGSFDITFSTTAGTTTEQPIFNFAVIKAVTS